MTTKKQKTSGVFAGGTQEPSINNYKMLCRIGQGSYGVVYKAQNTTTGEIVAIKESKLREAAYGPFVPRASDREVKLLRTFCHPAIVSFKESITNCKLGSIFIVMEHVDCNLKRHIDALDRRLTEREVKQFMYQLIDAVAYLHARKVVHRDLKLDNLLVSSDGKRLKVCDFGLSRGWMTKYLKPKLTQEVGVLCYRAPELLVGVKDYTVAIDVWSAGCIMAEMLLKKPLFEKATEIGMLDGIFALLGAPERSWPRFEELANMNGASVTVNRAGDCTLRQMVPLRDTRRRPGLSEAGFHLLKNMLQCDSQKRITAKEALQHRWFDDIDADEIYSN